MASRWVGLCFGILLVFVAAAQQRLTDPQVAGKLGITVQQLHTLRAGYDMTNEQLLALSRIQLQRLLRGTEHPGIDRHAEEQNFRALRMMNEDGRIPPDGLLRAMEHRRHAELEADLLPGQLDPSTNTPSFGDPGSSLAGIEPNGWTWLGPGNIGGRVRAIVIHPTQPNILWCGGVDGGIWKSTNNGAAWFPLDDFMANLAICSLAIDPADPNTLYTGTGEATHNADSIRGAGIFKTIDGGATWFRLPNTAVASFQYVGRLSFDPNDSQILLAATRSGVFRSVNGGTNWTQRATSEYFDVQFHPFDSALAVASGTGGRAAYSTDGGLTWFSATGLPGSGRIEVTYARSAPDCVYASCENLSGQLYRSTDGGRTYAMLNSGYNYLGSQGWYDNVVWVDPTTTNLVIVGGIDLWRSTDGGVTLTRISQWQSAPTSAHADHHAIVNSPDYDGGANRTVYFGNDGGVYRANDVATVSSLSGWQALNNNLGITQFYGGAGNTNNNVIIGGTQDNGTLRYNGNAQGWTTMYGGDGGFCAADPFNPNYFYGEYVYLQIHRSVNGGTSSSYITSGLTDAGSSSTANFIAPFILDPNNPNTMLAGGASLWRSVNVRAATPTWSAIKGSTGSRISAIAVASGNSDIIWVGHNNGDVFYTMDGTAPSPGWTRADLGTPSLPNRYCERIAISPVDPSKVYVTFGGFNSDNVWRTSNNGLTWSNISANLPPAPVNAIVIAPADPNTLYVGTEVGVYGTSSDGGNWSTGNDGPANVSIDELFWLGPRLVAVTHGRGMYWITPALGGASLVAATSVVLDGNGNGAIDPNECSQVQLVIQNVGGAPATNITGRLTLTASGATVAPNTSTYPDLGPTALGTNQTLFQISTDPSFTCGTAITATLELVFNGTTNILSYNLPTSGSGYTITQTTGASIVPGTTDILNHGDDVVTSISLPFSVRFYGQDFDNAALSSNGNLQFQSSDNQYANECLPYGGFSYAIMAFWDDLRTDFSGANGIFTSISGSAPNRIFNIEWRTTYFSPAGTGLNFEVRLYEGQSRFDIIYGTLNGSGSTATVGAQQDNTTYNSFSCNGGTLSPGLQLTFQQTCADGGGACAEAPLILLPPTQSPPQFIFSFQSVLGKTYEVQSSGTLNGVDWQAQGQVLGDGSLKTVTNTFGPTNLFYRLKVL